MEDFGLYNEVVRITDFLLDLRNLFTWETRNDTVYQRSAYIAILRKPSLEFFIICTEIFFPQFDVLVDTFFQMMSVQENQLTRHDDKSFGLVTLESFETAIQQLGQFARIRRCGGIGKLTACIKSNTRLRSVGDDKTNFRLVGKRHECGVL